MPQVTVNVDPRLGNVVFSILMVTFYAGLAMVVGAAVNATLWTWKKLVSWFKWHRPSRRASRQLNIARRKHAKLLAEFKKLRADRGLDRTFQESLVGWDHPSLEDFVDANYWQNPAQAIGDIRLFITKSRQRSATERES